ncbi:MAG TPA: hypothetical protein VMH81_01445 [Bryobacteraceae bacterium]|nr:hypothetical protein [Bryobacteraceae bacterium]
MQDLARRWIAATFHAKRIDVKSLAEPHAYGPSLRRLWTEAGNLGHDPWEHIQNWALHIPKSFQGYDPDEFFERYKINANRALQEEMSPKENKKVARVLAKPIEWRATGDLTAPWSAESQRHTYRVRLNDFPDEWMYSLIVDETELGDFHDWPDIWKRVPQKRPAQPRAGKVRKVSTRTAVEVDPDQLLSRYRNGEHEAVSCDLESLGERVREPRYLEAARAPKYRDARQALTGDELPLLGVGTADGTAKRAAVHAGSGRRRRAAKEARAIGHGYAVVAGGLGGAGRLGKPDGSASEAVLPRG